jgi:AraC family transcriptional regulator of adaptative response/methylated-DNA-[protein]-cysteine methyltransferase
MSTMLVEPKNVADDARWRAVVEKDLDADGTFIVAVHSTKIYCRPSCPSRLPRRDGVTLYDTREEARAAGYRACLRCRPDDYPQNDIRALVRRACEAIDSAEGERVALREIAAELETGERTLYRGFQRVLGITPKQYADSVRVKRLKEGLRDGGNVTRVMYDAGYGSPSRLYEGAAERLGMTPATYGRKGKGAEIAFSIVPSPLGRVLVAATHAGVCSIMFGESDDVLEASLHAEFSAARTITRDDESIGAWVTDVLARLDTRARRLVGGSLPLDIRGTAFQRIVWQELMRVPAGSTRTYTQIAETVASSPARRAVARACATNPVPIVVPCHRIVRGDGGLGGYAYGLDRKRKLLDIEKKQANGKKA